MTRRRLDIELVRRSLVESRTEARRAIDAGRVVVAGVVDPKPATLVAPEDSVRLVGPGDRYVSRGGQKLEAALESFGVDVTGIRALDVGSSTGGFTDCLLQHGAGHVVAVDVGYGQLHWRLRNDDRVTVVERTNIRLADLEDLGAPFDVVVADLSFISLRIVAPALRAGGHDDTHYLVLVKPQFEVGREHVERGGLVRDPSLHVAALRSVAEAFAAEGMPVVGVRPSPILGASGNREFLVHARPGGVPIGHDAIDEAVAP